MTIEELRAMYAGAPSDEEDSGEAQSSDPEAEGESDSGDQSRMDANMETKSNDKSSRDGDDVSDEYENVDDDLDDETTLIEEERLASSGAGGDAGYAEELEALQKEAVMSIEELRAMYAGACSDEEEETGVDADYEGLLESSDSECSESEPDEIRSNSKDALRRKRIRSSELPEENDTDSIEMMNTMEGEGVTSDEFLTATNGSAPMELDDVEGDGCAGNQDFDEGVESALRRLEQADEKARSVHVSRRDT